MIAQGIPVPQDTRDMPVLLLKCNAETGNWAWKRTGKGPWIGGFATAPAAIAEAERLGLPLTREIIFVETDDE